MSATAENQLMMLFERPYEPVFFPKGENVTLEVPEELVKEEHRSFVRSSASLAERFPDARSVNAALPRAAAGDAAFTLHSSAADAETLAALADAADVMTRDETFSVHVPAHRKAAARLISALLDAKSNADMLVLAMRSRETVNPQLFQYALSVAVLHRPGLSRLRPPSLLSTMPGKFLSGATLRKCFDQANLYAESQAQRRETVVEKIAQSATDADPEHKLAYFREDWALNMHHWHWHLVYPNTAAGAPNMRAIVAKDRRGELFYYMHHQILARYNAERFSVGLGRLQRLKNFRDPLVHGHFPKLANMSGEAYVGRPDNVRLSDVSREDRKVEIKQLERWEDRVYYAVHSNSYINANSEHQTFGDDGIDVLGNILESSDLTPNKRVYGDLHNLAHIAVSVCHDPDGKHLEGMGVMSGSETAMRDPVFYQVHAFIDRIFREYKHTLPPYTLKELQLPGISVVKFQVQSVGLSGRDGPPPNLLFTHWQMTEVDVSPGLNYAPRGTLRVALRHLQHADFKYSIEVFSSQSRKCVVRLFLAPQQDDRGIALPFSEQKEYFIEMDKFEADVPSGKSVIERESRASSVTIPWKQTFRPLEIPAEEEGAELQEFGYCGCGWPQHLLLPRGRPGGLPCVFFVMLTPFDTDIVAPLPNTETCNKPECKSAVSYCGARDSKYPDRRPMGFPFDRLSRSIRGVKNHKVTLQHFMQDVANMGSVDVQIVHYDKEINP